MNFLHNAAAASTGAPADWLPRWQAARRVLVACDFDGTVAPIAARPDLAQPLPAAQAALAQLAQQHGVRVALVSGRPLADLRARCPIPACLYLGSHGNESSADAEPPSPGSMLARRPELAAEVARRLAQWPGVRVEDKPFSFTLHYRQAPGLAPEVESFADALAAAHGLRPLPARLAIELLPTNLTDKGQAVVALQRRQGCDLALYFGDDRSDEDVFAFRGPALIAIRVENEETPPLTAADYTLRGPDEVALALRHLAALSFRRQPTEL